MINKERALLDKRISELDSLKSKMGTREKRFVNTSDINKMVVSAANSKAIYNPYTKTKVNRKRA